jgi:uncharacterized protein
MNSGFRNDGVDPLSCIVDDRLRVRVKPSARKTELLKVKGLLVHIAVAAPPEDGKANAELERFLSKLLKRKATVKSGFTSRDKVVALGT